MGRSRDKVFEEWILSQTDYVGEKELNEQLGKESIKKRVKTLKESGEYDVWEKAREIKMNNGAMRYVSIFKVRRKSDYVSGGVRLKDTRNELTKRIWEGYEEKYLSCVVESKAKDK